MHARRAELVSAIDILARAESALRVRRGGVAGDSTAGATSDGGGGGVTPASATRSLRQARRLRDQFDRRWGFTRDRTLGATLEVCVWGGVGVGRCVYLTFITLHRFAST